MDKEFKSSMVKMALNIIQEQGQEDYWRVDPVSGYGTGLRELVSGSSSEWETKLGEWVEDKELIGTTSSNWFDEGGNMVILYFANAKAKRRIWKTFDEFDSKEIFRNIVELAVADSRLNCKDYVVVCSGPY